MRDRARRLERVTLRIRPQDSRQFQQLAVAIVMNLLCSPALRCGTRQHEEDEGAYGQEYRH